MIPEIEEQRLRELLEAELRRQIAVGLIASGRVDLVEMTGPRTFRVRESLRLRCHSKPVRYTMQIGPNIKERLP